MDVIPRHYPHLRPIKDNRIFFTFENQLCCHYGCAWVFQVSIKLTMWHFTFSYLPLCNCTETWSIPWPIIASCNCEGTGDFFSFSVSWCIFDCQITSGIVYMHACTQAWVHTLHFPHNTCRSLLSALSLVHQAQQLLWLFSSPHSFRTVTCWSCCELLIHHNI